MRPVATAMRRVWHKACLLTKKACLLTSMLFAPSIISERSKDSAGTNANLNPCPQHSFARHPMTVVDIDVEVGKLPAWPEIHMHARMD